MTVVRFPKPEPGPPINNLDPKTGRAREMLNDSKVITPTDDPCLYCGAEFTDMINGMKRCRFCDNESGVECE